MTHQLTMAAPAWPPAPPRAANAVTASWALTEAGFPATGTPIELTLRRTGLSLIIEVRDPNPDPPALRPAGPLDEGGRGLVMVDVLSSRWGHYAAERGGKVVWCEIGLTGRR